MSPKRWIFCTIALTLGTAGAFAGFNTAYDLYGQYRPSQGRKLAAWGDSRIAKYLLSGRYVPENFTGVFVGTSVTVNWDVSRVGPFRVYNESLNGGNAAEEKAIVERVLERPGIRVAFVLVQPYLTHSHAFETAELTPRLRYSGLGSLSLLEDYKAVLKAKVQHVHEEADWKGTESFDQYKLVLNPTLRQMFQPGREFDIDPIALAAYRDLATALRSRGIQTVFVEPPIYEQLLKQQRAAFANYNRRIGEIANGDPWIDFNADRYADLRRDRGNYGDGIHMLPPMTRRVVAELDKAVTGLVHQERLRLP